jgi:hypothetical protein
VKPRLRRLGLGDEHLEEYAFECPGCGCCHRVRVQGPEPVWWWNRSLERPTFTPSLRVRWGDVKGNQTCHSFITDGRIMFLNDCTHVLAGQTMDLPDLED